MLSVRSMFVIHCSRTLLRGRQNTGAPWIFCEGREVMASRCGLEGPGVLLENIHRKIMS